TREGRNAPRAGRELSEYRDSVPPPQPSTREGRNAPRAGEGAAAPRDQAAAGSRLRSFDTSHSSTSPTKGNAAGTTTRLRMVEVIRPPITATAIGARKLASAVRPSAIGIMPAPIAMVVMITGRARLWQASISASWRD